MDINLTQSEMIKLSFIEPNNEQIEGLPKNPRFIKNDNVLDLFGVSGTTLIACEQLNRKCFMMEYDPHYCDVIIARWEKLTGKKAVKIA